MPPDTAEASRQPLRILGVDPGSRITGFGIIDCLGNVVSHISSGCIKVPEAALPQRLHLIHRDLQDLIKRYQPSVMAVEQVFVNRNAASALKLGQARGAAICAAAGQDETLEIVEYTPAEVKKAIVGHGRAAKTQIQHMVAMLLQLPDSLAENLAEDAADALAVALCHARLAAQPGARLAGWTKPRRRGRRATSAAAYTRSR